MQNEKYTSREAIDFLEEPWTRMTWGDVLLCSFVGKPRKTESLGGRPECHSTVIDGISSPALSSFALSYQANILPDPDPPGLTKNSLVSR